MARAILRRLAASLTLSLCAAAAPSHAAPAWTLDPAGFGPLKFGMDFDAARRAGARGIKPTPPPQGNPQCDQMLLPGHPGVSLMFVDGVLRRVDIYRAGIRTTRGVATGDPVARARRAYPHLDDAAGKYGPGARNLTLGPDHDQALRFETRAGKVTRIYAGRWQEVQLVEGCF